MEDNNNDTFANLRLLVDTACFLFSMEKLAPHGGVTSFLSNLHANGASKINLLIRKKIHASDVNRILNRLSIPQGQVMLRGFLTAEEDQMLKEKKGFMVSLFLPWLNITQEVSFKLWNSGTPSYVICGKWSQILKRSIFNEGDDIELWYIRNNSGKLCLVLLKDN